MTCYLKIQMEKYRILEKVEQFLILNGQMSKNKYDSIERFDKNA